MTRSEQKPRNYSRAAAADEKVVSNYGIQKEGELILPVRLRMRMLGWKDGTRGRPVLRHALSTSEFERATIRCACGGALDSG